MNGLATATDITGWVGDDSGVPVSDVAIVAYDQRFSYAVARTCLGAYSFSDLPDNWYRVRLVPIEDQPGQNIGFRAPWMSVPVPCGIEMKRGSRIRHVSLLGAQITGRLVDAEGSPVVNASVKAVLPDSMRTQAREAVTDEQGAFTVFGLPPEAGDDTEWITSRGSGVPSSKYGAGVRRSGCRYRCSS